MNLKDDTDYVEATMRSMKFLLITYFKRLASRRGYFLRRGSVLVEFAVIAPIFIFITAMLVQFAVYGNSAIHMSQLAREGARAASVSGTTNEQIVGKMQQAAQGSSIPVNLITGGSGGTVTIDPDNVNSRIPGTVVTVTFNHNLDRVRFLPNTFLGFQVYSTNIGQKASMRVEGLSTNDPSATPVPVPTATPRPTPTPYATPTPVPTATPTPRPTATPTRRPTPTRTPRPR